MSDLTGFRDYCRRMGGGITQRNIHLTGEQRALFRLLAREVDAYLAGDLEEASPASDEQPLEGL